MGAQRLILESKVRTFPTEVASLAHFQYHEGEAIDARVVVEQPNISLYCLDHANRRAIFVQTAPDADLGHAPFYYQAQYAAATELIAVSYETLHQLASTLSLDPQRIILVYSVGRCGSTLVSRALSQADGVYSAAEPDVFTQLTAGRSADIRAEAVVSALVNDCTKVMYAGAQSGGAVVWAAKFRSIGIDIGDLLYRHFPAAKVVFLYRNAEAWAKSAARAYRIYDVAGQGVARNQQLFPRLNPTIREYMATHAPLSPVEILSCMWVSRMERCLELQQQGIPMFCARYEDLVAKPRPMLDAMFDYCGVKASDPAKLDTILTQDSQTGTSLSQAKLQASGRALPEQDLPELFRLIQQFSPTLTPDILVPGTFLPS